MTLDPPWEGRIRLYVGHSGTDPDAVPGACETMEHGVVISAVDVVAVYRKTVILVLSAEMCEREGVQVDSGGVHAARTGREIKRDLVVRRIFRSAATVPLCGQYMRCAWVLLVSKPTAENTAPHAPHASTVSYRRKTIAAGSTVIAAKAPGPHRHSNRSMGETQMQAPASPKTRADSLA